MISKTLKYLRRRKSELQRAKSKLPENIRMRIESRLPKFISEESFYKIRGTADSSWKKDLENAIPHLFAKKWTKKVFKVNKRSRKTRDKGASLKLDLKALDLFERRYFSAVISATEYYADLLAESAASREGLDEKALSWIENEIESYARGKLENSVVEQSLAGAMIVFRIENAEDYYEIIKLPKFKEALYRVCSRYSQWSAATMNAMEKLRLIASIKGTKKRYRRVDPLVLENSSTRSSYSQRQAGQLLGIQDRRIRQLVAAGKLNRTKTGRIPNDEKLDDLRRQRNSAANS